MSLRFDKTDTSAICHLFVPAATDSTQLMLWTVRRGDLSTLVMIQFGISKHPFFAKCACDSQVNSSIPSILRKHEQEKKREYNDRVMQVEQGTFTPLVFAIPGSMGPECLQFHKSLAKKLVSKSGERYSVVIYIRCKS